MFKKARGVLGANHGVARSWFAGGTAVALVATMALPAVAGGHHWHHHPSGTLKVTKEFDPLRSGFAGTFEVKVDCSNDSFDQTLTLAAGQSAAINNIPVRTTCTVTEPDLPDAPDGWTFGRPTINPSSPVTITRHKTWVKVTNSIHKKRTHKGTLKVTKEFDPRRSGFAGTFEVKVVCSNDSFDQTLTLAAGQSAAITNIPVRTTCTVTEPDLPDAPDGWTFGRPTINPSSPVTITRHKTWVKVTNSIHKKRTHPEIDIEKLVWDGSAFQDADIPTGPSLPSGTNPVFRFVVTNTGDVPLTGVTLTDDPAIDDFFATQALTGPCTIPNPLAVDASFTCYASLPWAAGQQEDTGSTTGQYGSTTVDDTDLAHYLGTTPATPRIDVEKLVWDGSAFQDADIPTGPSLPSGTNPVFRFVVTNTGDVPLTGVTLTDDPAIDDFFATQALTGPCTIPNPLAVDASFTCYASLPWAAGQQEDTGSTTGQYGSTTVDDTDLAHYLGTTPATPRIDVEKLVWDGSAFQDADIPTGPSLPSGTNPVFRFLVTNTGDVPLTGVTLTDDPAIDDFFATQALTGPCTIPNPLAVDASFTCYASLPWAAGQQEDTGSTTGQYGSTTVDDTDLAHYLGTTPATPRIDVEKWVSVDGGASFDDADTPPGPSSAPGSPVRFRFIITNTGNVTLTNLTLADSDFTFAANECVLPTSLAPRGVFTCGIIRTLTPGQHTDTATATGTPPVGEPVRDSDGANVLIALPGITNQTRVTGSLDEVDPSVG